MATQNVLKVRSVAKSFRRAGMVFTQSETLVNASDLTDTQILALKQDPGLVVIEVVGVAAETPETPETPVKKSRSTKAAE